MSFFWNIVFAYVLVQSVFLRMIVNCTNLISFDWNYFAQKSPLCSETDLGQGGTTAWKMCGLDKATSLCLVFDIVKKG